VHDFGHRPSLVGDIMRRGAIAAGGCMLAILCGLGAIALLVAAVHAYVAPLLGAPIAAVVSAGALAVIILLVVLAVKLMRRPSVEQAANEAGHGGNAEMLALLGRVMPEIVGKHAPLVTVGLAALAGVMFGSKR